MNTATVARWAADTPADFRGPTMPDLARRVAGRSPTIDARAIGRVAARIAPEPPRPRGDAETSDAQQLKKLWHTVLAHGRDAEPSSR